MQGVLNKSLVIITCSVFLTACSMSFIYNNLAWLSNWYLDDYVTLNSQQQQAFDTAFNDLHRWHRQSQLTVYGQQLALFKEQVNLGISATQLQQHLSAIEGHWQVLRQRATPQLLTLIHSLDEQQRQQILAAVDEKNQRRIKNYKQLSVQKWQSKQCKNMQKQLKKWLGKLTKSQQLTVCEHTKTLQPTFTEWMAYRQQWHSNLAQAFLLSGDKQQYELLLTELVAQPELAKTEQYLALSAANQQAYISTIEVVFNNLTAKQQKRLHREIDGIIDDLQSLALDN